MAWQVSGRGFGAALAAPPVTARIGRRLGLATADLRRPQAIVQRVDNRPDPSEFPRAKPEICRTHLTGRPSLHLCRRRASGAAAHSCSAYSPAPRCSPACSSITTLLACMRSRARPTRARAKYRRGSRTCWRSLAISQRRATMRWRAAMPPRPRCVSTPPPTAGARPCNRSVTMPRACWSPMISPAWIPHWPRPKARSGECMPTRDRCCPMCARARTTMPCHRWRP